MAKKKTNTAMKKASPKRTDINNERKPKMAADMPPINPRSAAKKSDTVRGTRAETMAEEEADELLQDADKTIEEKKKVKKEKPEKLPGNPDSIGSQVMSAMFWVLSALTVVFFIAGAFDEPGPLITFFCTAFYGFFGGGAFVLIFVLAYMGFTWKRCVVRRNAGIKLLFGLLLMFTFAIVYHIITIMAGRFDVPDGFTDIFAISDFWYDDEGISGGGIFGGIFGGLFYFLMKGAVALITSLILLIGSVMAFFEITPKKLAATLKNTSKAVAEVSRETQVKNKEKKLAKKEKKKLEQWENKRASLSDNKKQQTNTSGVVSENDKHDDNIENDDVRIDIFGTHAPKTSKSEASENKDNDYNENQDEKEADIAFDFDDEPKSIPDSEIDISKIFTYKSETTAAPDDPDDIDKDETSDIAEDSDNEIDGDNNSVIADTPLQADEEPKKKEYILPPSTLLYKDDTPRTVESEAELMRNGRKLVEVLKSFKVDTEIVNISCGPTITRYELAPKIGVRVRAIANLVDDIALNLETSGVRIEAPIPGKAAVGIEVPNKNCATVYLKELIESPEFVNAKSKLTVCLGVDVAGKPLLMDIAKMPHLLIAGATGMGKSVSVNSIIMSLLYKSTPDEVKLILVDPKKVELSVYNKLPHLLIPVVNNPKKAAGALATAVNEMERRFELIESVGMRDIKGYNKVTENDPAKEFLPQIVIIIDELADLMLTAKDDVEDSICRLAQKARAAGIHLIICTQRPSVDVITGLIKANVPSRIAFTVASNIDSRTIIDIAGAEKLIGRGDMLFAPVGAMKPVRAQGAFVSDKEVEDVTTFIKNQAGDVQYDDTFISKVEVAAEKCGQPKKKLSGDEIDSDSDLDPKFYDAIEVALEMGKISTSLLQRRLSLGYGRAAKIIDKMEEMNIVGAQEGQKPRNLLISRQDYQELIMKKDDAPLPFDEE